MTEQLRLIAGGSKYDAFRFTVVIESCSVVGEQGKDHQRGLHIAVPVPAG
jgi:hypothetical protein